jgi:hypothetical protein
MDWRIKYYGLQGIALSFTAVLIAAGFGLAFFLDREWPVWLTLPLGCLITGAGWLVAQNFAPHSGKHLTPREWEELRGALEDVAVMSVFHIVTVDKRRLERFRYLPLLRRYLWECFAADEIDEERIVRAAFLLHNFGEDLSEFSDAAVLIEDPVVRSWFQDVIVERRGLRRREALLRQTDCIPTLMRDLGQEPSDDGDPAMQAAWRLLLFGPIAHEKIREGLTAKSPRIREASLALLAIQHQWPERRTDLEARLRDDLNPSVQHAAMELIALDGRAAIPILEEMAQDPFLSGRAGELLSEIDGRRRTSP